VTEKMKKTGMSSEWKVALVTGASEGIGAALVKAYRALAAGAFCFLSKPITKEGLLTCLGAALRGRTSARPNQSTRGS
jgi:NAD(P)-dependent dehydrogenase (short-subunit alcohol dehydrogenase family)